MIYLILWPFFHQTTICDVRVFGSGKQSEWVSRLCLQFYLDLKSWLTGRTPSCLLLCWNILLWHLILPYLSLSRIFVQMFLSKNLCARGSRKKSIKAAKVVNNITLLKKICNADVLKSMAKMLARAISFRIKQFCCF